MSSADAHALSAGWGYVIGGISTLVMAIIVIVVSLCRQYCKEQAMEERKKAARSAKLLQWQQQANSFTNIAYRSDTDILTRLGMSELQSIPTPPPPPPPPQQSDA
jgi:hypothetical protein